MSDQVTAPVVKLNTPQPSELLWSDLCKEFIKVLKKEGREKQEGNFKSAFKFFLESLEQSEDSPVGAEFGDEFEARVEVYVKFEIARNIKSTTYGPRVSKIKELKKFAEANYAESLRFQTLPKTFGQKLFKLITSLGFTIMSFWATLPKGLVGYNSLVSWCKERSYPSTAYLAAINTIETCLRAPIGTLRLSRYLCVGLPLKVGQTDVGKKMKAAQAKPYYVWTPSLEEEFKKLFTHKTEAILPEGEERHRNGQWTRSEGAGVPSADIVYEFLQSFMGFCALPKDNPDPYLRGQGIKPEELSLALLADKELVEAYLRFKKLRSGLRIKPLKEPKPALPAYLISADGKWEFYDKGGKYNRGSILALVYISGLLRPGTGYLYQHNEFANKLGARMTSTSWQEQCAATRTRVYNVLREIWSMKKNNDLDNFDFGRDPKEQIDWILGLDRPLLVLQEMLKEMLDDLLPKSAPLLLRAKQYRDLLLFALLCANPLRVRMFSIMEFDKNLVRMEDGSWRLRFKRGAFKNRKSLKSDYEVGIAKELWPILDRYRKEFHPILAGSTGSSRVFIRCGRYGPGNKQGSPLGPASLNRIIHKLTQVYTPGEIGFSPHAFRHIVATDIIKKDPRIGFFLASRALHDKLETVEKEYIHLKMREFFEPVNTHFSEAWHHVFNIAGNIKTEIPVVV